MKIQPRSKRPRVRKATTLDERIERRVEQTAAKFGVSKSWVRATALAQYFGVEIVVYEDASK